MDHVGRAKRETWEEEAGEPAEPVDERDGAQHEAVPVKTGGVLASLARVVRRWGTSSPAPGAGRREGEGSRSIEVYKAQWAFVARMLQRSDLGPESARDIHQEVFMTMDEQLEREENIANVEAMLVTITGRKVCNHLRRRRRRLQHEVAVDATEMPSSQAGIEQRMDVAEQKRRVGIVLSRLPEKMALMIWRLDFAELTVQEVAGELRCPVETVRTRHRRARIKFRALWESLYGPGREGDA